MNFIFYSLEKGGIVMNNVMHLGYFVYKMFSLLSVVNFSVLQSLTQSIYDLSIIIPYM